jgi:Mn-dependent DtxR family transcriptional regulator
MNILRVLEKLKVRYRNPINLWPIVDGARNGYSMSNTETYDVLNNLEKIGYIEIKNNYISLTEKQDNKIYSQRREIMNGEYTIDQRKAARFKMLEKIYMETGGVDNSYFDIYDIGEKLNYSTDLTVATAEYLANEGLIEYMTLNGGAGITHSGIVQYEQAVSKPAVGNKHFPSVNIIQNIFNADNIENVQIQQHTTNSKQEMNRKNEYDNVLLWLQNFEEALKKENENEVLEKLGADIEFIKNNIASGKPENKYIKLAMDTIKGELIKLTASAIFQTLLQTLPTLIP